MSILVVAVCSVTAQDSHKIMCERGKKTAWCHTWSVGQHHSRLLECFLIISSSLHQRVWWRWWGGGWRWRCEEGQCCLTWLRLADTRTWKHLSVGEIRVVIYAWLTFCPRWFDNIQPNQQHMYAENQVEQYILSVFESQTVDLLRLRTLTKEKCFILRVYRTGTVNAQNHVQDWIGQSGLRRCIKCSRITERHAKPLVYIVTYMPVSSAAG